MREYREKDREAEMPAGGHPSRWREIKVSDPNAGVLKDRATRYRTIFESEKLRPDWPPPPAVKGGNASFFKGKYAGTDKASTPNKVFKDCSPDDVSKRE